MRQTIIAILLTVLTGCSGSPGGDGGILNRLNTLPDANSNGFPETPVPDGVDEMATVAIDLVNSITRSQAERLARVNIPDFVKRIVAFRVRLVVDVTYPGEITDRLTGSRPIGTFDVKAEVVCPIALEVRVAVVADIPLVGERTVQSFGPFRLERDALTNGYQCGSIITITMFVDDDGRAASTVEVQPMSGD